MSFTDSIYIIFLATGFTVGFGHCIGMCGPIVVSFSLSLKNTPHLWPHLLYNVGRITTYAAMGAVLGATGAYVGLTARLANLQQVVMVLTGVLIVGMGAATLGWLPWAKIWQADYTPGNALRRVFSRINQSRKRAAFLPLGLVLGLLPCGPVYTALIAATRVGMEAGHPLVGLLHGAGVMLAFGLGTVPALVLVARLAAMHWVRARHFIYRTGAVLMMAAGVIFIYRGIRFG